MTFGMMKIVVFTKPGCSYCVKAKELLTQKGFDYGEISVGPDGNISRDSFLSLYPDVKKLPLIKINDDIIGGYDNLVTWMDKYS